MSESEEEDYEDDLQISPPPFLRQNAMIPVPHRDDQDEEKYEDYSPRRIPIHRRNIRRRNIVSRSVCPRF
jgi:hypothetical protein